MKNKDKENFDFIKNKFDNDNLKAPGVLDETGAKNLIEDKIPKKLKIYKTKTFKAVVSLVACFAVVITSLTFFRPYSIDKNSIVYPEQNSSSVLPTFASYDDIEKTVKEIEKNEKNTADFAFGYRDTLKSAEMQYTAENAEGGSMARDYSETYKQLETVDEADIIKNNGEYIFWINSERNVVSIYKGKELVSEIDDFDSEKYDGTENEYFIDMFLYNEKLILNSWKSSFEDGLIRDFTITSVYNISDIENPEKINSFAQSGSYISSRITDGQLYVATNEYIYSEYCKDYRDYVPCVAEDGGKTEPIALDSIYYCDSPSDTGYLIVSSINVENGEKAVSSKALFGGGSDIYCNENNMYVAMNKFVWKPILSTEDSRCQIVKIKLGKENIDFVAVGEVDGNTHNQFSMDEKDGYLRVATTSINSSGENVNNLYVLDENLEKVGEVTDFAKNESIQAVRFIGDMAYVITYEQIDPLFVIDVSDPAVPQIKGSVEISGFSSLLVPVDENTLLGIGYETKVNDIGITVDGIKLALFDISNPESPKVLDSYVKNDADSDAQSNHHALVVNREKGYYAIPYNAFYYTDSGEYEEYHNSDVGVLMFSVKDNKIVVENDFSAENKNECYSSRCTYIDDSVYLFQYGQETVIDEFKTK